MELVNVVISIYKPDLKYMKKQMESLENQDYDNIEIIIRDDNPNSQLDTKIFDSIFKRKKYRYIKGEENLGYAKSFEYLTEICSGKYIAYCDQDDIWMHDKISKCVAGLEQEKAVLVTSDRAIIDENDVVIEEAYRNNHHNVCDTWKTGDHITTYAVFTTCAIGMNIVMETEIAKKLLPLPENTAHDKWMTAGASVFGTLVFLEEPLVAYRRHTSNVSGILNGITSKTDYYKERVEYSYYLAKEFVKRFPDLQEEDRNTILRFAEARKKKQLIKMFSMRKLAPNIIKFEIMLKLIPDSIFKMGIILLKRRIKY